MNKTDKEIMRELEGIRENLTANYCTGVSLTYEEFNWLIGKAKNSFIYKEALENMEGELSRGYLS